MNTKPSRSTTTPAVSGEESVHALWTEWLRNRADWNAGPHSDEVGAKFGEREADLTWSIIRTPARATFEIEEKFEILKYELHSGEATDRRSVSLVLSIHEDVIACAGRASDGCCGHCE